MRRSFLIVFSVMPLAVAAPALAKVASSPARVLDYPARSIPSPPVVATSPLAPVSPSPVFRTSVTLAMASTASEPDATDAPAKKEASAGKDEAETAAPKKDGEAESSPAPEPKPPAPAGEAAPPAPKGADPDASPKPESPNGATPEKSPAAPDAGQPPVVPPANPPPEANPALPPLPPPAPLPVLPEIDPFPKPPLPTPEPMLPGSELFLIPNGIIPVPRPPLIPTPEIMGFKLPPEPSAAVELLKPEEITIPVTKFNLRYAPSPGKKPDPALPPIDRLQKATASLAEVGGVFVAASPKASAKSKVSVGLNGASAQPRQFRGDAVDKLGQSVVDLIKKSGIEGVYVIPDPAEIDRRKGKAFDQRGGKTELSLVIYVSHVTEVHTLGKKMGAPVSVKPIVDAPKDARIKAKSPIGGASGTTVLNKAALEDYLDRLNRFPNREVETSIVESPEDHHLTLNYLVKEDKPIFLYAETSNTGTPTTGEWRTRMGLEWDQVLRLDDILRAEYVGAHMSDYFAGFLTYEIAPIFPDYLKFKAFGSYSKYSAQDIGIALENFESSAWVAGGQVTWTPLYIHGFPLDINVGFQWMRLDVDHLNIGRDGQTSFALPFAGIGTERTTPTFSISANAQVEFSWFRLSGTQEADLPTLGRVAPDRNFTLGTWNFNGSFFLEPLLFGKAWDAQQVWWKSTRAHEIALSFHGQVAFDRARLAPQLEMTAGGFDTVRGYPEALVAGDTVLLASAEYRLHVPRLFVKRGPVDKNEMEQYQFPGDAFLPPRPGSILNSGFNPRPASMRSAPNWDLILRGFFDFGEVYENKSELAPERNRVLASIGGGIEVQLLKPLMVSLRMDVGYALFGEREFLTQRVDQGDVRFHFAGSIAW